ncbi:MAG: hypothetical protein OHK0021_08070 [Bryobacter sp.]|nr:EthD family reductase [Bryobacter sp.]
MSQEMICVSAFYPAAGEGRFDFEYYLNRHIPLVRQLLTPLGMLRMEADEGLGGFLPGSAPNYRAIARMYFSTVEEFQHAAETAGNQIFADIPNYTDIPVEIQVSRVRAA